MVLMLRLTLGLLILLYAADTADIQRSIEDSNNNNLRQTNQNITNDFQINDNNETVHNNSKEISDEDVENIVKPLKFSTNDNNNSTKLKKSEPYSSNERSKDENSRIGNGRSVDIDIEKYISPDFHNAVYTLPNSKQEESSEEIHSHSTEMVGSFEHLELTTPKTPFFDQKFRQTVDNVNKKLLEFPERETDNLTHSTANYSSNNFIEESDSNPRDTKLEYKIFENDELNKTKKPHGIHTDITQERRTILNFESQHNETTAYDERTPSSEDSNELHKENLKYLLGDENVNEVKKVETSLKPPSISKTNFHSTTIKYTITKPSTQATDTGIMNNKIESETIKSQHTTTPMTSSEETTTDKVTNKSISSIRGSIKFADYQKNNNNSLSTTPKNKTLEQVVQENQIIPIQVTPPPTTTTAIPIQITSLASTIMPNITTVSPQVEAITLTNTTEPSTTTKIEAVSVKNNTIGPDEQQSTTVLIFVLPDNIKLETTTENEIEDKTTTLTSLPRGFTLPITTEDFIPSTEIQDTTDRVETTSLKSEETTTMTSRTEQPETTTFRDIISTLPPVTEVEISTEKNYSTQSSILIKTTTDKIETTTQIPTTIYRTTFSEARSSKGMKFSDTTTLLTTEGEDETTPYMTEAIKSTTVVSTSAQATKNEEPTTIEDISTETITVSTTTKTNSTIVTIPRETTSSTKKTVDFDPTRTLLENKTSEGTTALGTNTPASTISLVHVKNIDINHTTMYPDVLKPNEIYSTPVTVAPQPTAKTTTETITTEDSTPSELDGHGGSNGAIVAIVISCVGGICLIALACLLIVMRNRQKRFNYGQRCRPVSLDDYSVDNVSVFNSVRRKAAARGSKRSYGNPAFEDPVCLSHPLNFPAISKFAANEEDVNAEFRDIPQIIARTSELPDGCETKNRYANVIPLPESRVFLNYVEGYPNSDYINANFVTGPKNIRKYYIACQAPMSNTVDDFWRMVWEQQCKVILMMTHLFENGSEKCFDYLPPSEVLDCHRLFGDYQVTLKKREVKEKYIISSIQLKNMVSNSWREVTHFWYMGWPEKGVPTEANSIIAFLIEARSFMKTATIDKKSTINGDMNGTSSTEGNPVIVHCSPGTGRTGVVITCDIAIREFEQTRQVDIPKIVYRIRRDRASAVQTKEQYAFIYKVVDLYATKLAGGSLESI